ncbi:PSD1 and planctomycete cytochrome C domain-containing protein [Lignipirellula cremea]|uniref:Planctomycete cytochrome C n=1 Tax=Lignipirellula cremea TaxID=2528010 RepID=A0A518DLL5_9BACT|nr:PSD1 and planctomycete cytochrome C domain-containing protein [Lignipirellula cremea]QDU92722.1 Planctomycete cytochrome C [Lignipirellula cremea]
MKRSHFALFAVGLLTCAVASSFGLSPARAAEPDAVGLELFEKKIRPVLNESCYECHSAAAAKAGKLQAELMLDSREAIRKGGESGPAVVPGNVAESLLVSALRHENFQMPPKTKLPEEVIAHFVKWIELGAPDPRNDAPPPRESAPTIDIAAAKQFWSFRPLAESELPAAPASDWVRTDIDRFILAKLAEKQITPNPTIDREKLIRRVYFDLWGLPPSPDEVAAFAADDKPDAYERLLDRLLDSPRYGERWAQHWLDLARFAESNGYAFDKDRPAAFHYRDFVIRALNTDMPYDQFIHWQIAGDQLEPQDPLAQAATGFLAAGTFTSQQTQKERERSRYEQLDDIIATVGASTLGLTIGCARCHDHKFDPIPTRDYYRLIAAFAEVGFQDFDYDPQPEATRQAKAAFDQEHQPFLDARKKFEQEELPARFQAWEGSKNAAPSPWQLGPWQRLGPFPAADFKAAYNQAFAPEKGVNLTQEYDGLRWQAQPQWSDGQVHALQSGDFSALYLFRTIEVTAATTVDISLGHGDAIKVFLNGKQVLAKETVGEAAADQSEVKLALTPGRNELLLKVINAEGASGFYFQPKPAEIPKNIEEILKLAVDKRDAKQQNALHVWFAPRDADWVKLELATQEHLKQQPQPDITKIYAARDGGVTYNFGADTRKVYFLARGNSNTRQGLASPSFLQVLMRGESQERQWLASDPTAPSPDSPEAAAADNDILPRVGLAHWLTDTERGAGELLARVIVNRLWQHHLGRGIVATPSDFGSQGARPTHPELLDYLAGELIRVGWRLKPIHKLIMTSSVYRQAGKTNPAALQADPDNLLWWRRPSRRLEAEAIRDTLLAVSGSLDQKMYGPGSLDEANPRRSVYLTVKRSKLIPLLQLFDAPDAIQSIGDRNVTTVPPQALAMMNSPLVRQLAEKFARRVRPQADKPLEKVVRDAYQTALCRSPRPEELDMMTRMIEGQAEIYGGNETAQQTAVADFCQLVMCLNEFIFID